MIKRVHGIDRNKRSGPEDKVVIETGRRCFCWTDKVEERVAICFIMNPINKYCRIS